MRTERFFMSSIRRGMAACHINLMAMLAILLASACDAPRMVSDFHGTALPTSLFYPGTTFPHAGEFSKLYVGVAPRRTAYPPKGMYEKRWYGNNVEVVEVIV